jgi:choline dehydrogenase-like flavoprotein
LDMATLSAESPAIRPSLPLKFQAISRPVPMMGPVYDVVVIGSGYGGAIAASRMARAHKSVCLLELGKERWPGEFPSDILEAAPEIHVTGNVEPRSKLAELNTGNRQGLYHFVVGEGQAAFVANGTRQL